MENLPPYSDLSSVKIGIHRILFILQHISASNLAYNSGRIYLKISVRVVYHREGIAIILLRNWTITARVLIAYNILVRNLNPQGGVVGGQDSQLLFSA